MEVPVLVFWETSILFSTVATFSTNSLGNKPPGLPWWVREVKHLLQMWETWVQSLGWEDTLEKEMATTPILWLGKFMDRGPWQTTVHGVAKSWTQLSNFTFTFFQQFKRVPFSLHPHQNLSFVEFFIIAILTGMWSQVGLRKHHFVQS